MTLGADLVVNGDLAITGNDVLDVHTANHSINVGGDWSNDGGNSGFRARAGTVTFDGSGAQTINDANDWYNLAITTSTARTVSFESGETQSVAAGGSLTLTGTSGNLLTLAPLTAATDWLLDLDATASQSVSYVSVSYSDASGGAVIEAADGTNNDGGDNSYWAFYPPGISVNPTSGLTTTEAGGTAQFDVVLDAPPTADVTIGISSSDTGEGTVSTPSLTLHRRKLEHPPDGHHHRPRRRRARRRYRLHDPHRRRHQQRPKLQRHERRRRLGDQHRPRHGRSHDQRE